jgi:hypothetical protein
MEDALASHLVLRRLQLDDYDKGFVTLLFQLTETGEVTKEMFEKRFKEVRSIVLVLFLRLSTPLSLLLCVLFGW